MNSRIKENKSSLNEPGAKPEKVHKAFYFVLVLIPVLFFIMLEVMLRIFHYGVDTSQWKEIHPGKLMLNSDIARRYFYTTKNVPYSNQEIFDKIKSPNSFRVFVMGESSAAGYPYMPVGAFSDYIKTRLEILYPDSKIEVVNLGMTAINTYALRDMFPGVLDQKPDLVLIYTGHNEYYGALGVGSMESLGSSPSIVKFILSLNKFKTTELIRNIMSSAAGLFSSAHPDKEGQTLMSKIAGDQYIDYESDKYYAGLRQFESNMSDILQMAADKKVTVMLGTLTSNLKDQRPFVQANIKGQSEADKIYSKALGEYQRGNLTEAKRLFVKAKDMDGIRFRASDEFNNMIKFLGRKYACPVVDVDSAFCAESPGGVVGDNLMTDHLHPTLSGYQLMGKLYYEKMKKMGLLPKAKAVNLRSGELDSLTVSEYKVSGLDSAIASFRIKALKNDWPFIERQNKKASEALFKMKDYIDTLAFNICFCDLPWEEAHRKAADWYLSKNNFNEFQKQVDILISRFPIIKGYYTFIVNKLLVMKRYDEAYKYLVKYHNIRPDAFSAKWLGIIDLSRQKTDKAMNYLKESLMYDKNDAQVLYNLTGAYVNINDYAKALETIDQCLQSDPEFPGALELKAQLKLANPKL